MNQPQTIKIDDIAYIREDQIPKEKALSNRVLVRCRNAGVHVGELVERNTETLTLKNANRIWRWRGAHDLSYVAMHGVNRKEYTRISCLVPVISLTASDVCEVIPVAEGVDLTEVGIDHG